MNGTDGLRHTESRWMGLDVGLKRIGVAVSDPSKVAATPYSVITRGETDSSIREILEIARIKEVDRIIVGIPLGSRGEKSQIADRIEGFIDRLAKATTLPVEKWNERYSTRIAERVLLDGNVSRKKRRGIVDKMAAALILQNYMDAQSGGIVSLESREIWLRDQEDRKTDE